MPSDDLQACVLTIAYKVQRKCYPGVQVCAQDDEVRRAARLLESRLEDARVKAQQVTFAGPDWNVQDCLGTAVRTTHKGEELSGADIRASLHMRTHESAHLGCGGATCKSKVSCCARAGPRGCHTQHLSDHQM
jgi:hypothetical protein